MVLDRAPGRLELRDVPVPEPGPGQVRVRVHACAVCRTDLHVVDGELPTPPSRSCPGHQVVGTYGRRAPASASRGSVGRTATCRYCRAGLENLCDNARFTGYDLDGGYAEYLVADERFVLPFPTATRTTTRRRCSAPG